MSTTKTMQRRARCQRKKDNRYSPENQRKNLEAYNNNMKYIAQRLGLK